MPLKTTSYDGLLAHLMQLGIQRDTNVLVQSQLTVFGQIEGGVAAVHRAIREIVGNSATIAVPTYRLSSTELDPFDRSLSPSQECGVFSEYIRQLPSAIRSNCQMHSHAAIGPQANILEDSQGDVSLGPGSDFDAMHNAGFHLLMLGCDFRIATFAIHVQAMHGAIPYRSWLDLPRPRIGAQGEIVPAKCRYYARVTQNSIEDLEIVGSELRRQGFVKSARSHYGSSNHVSLAAFYDCEMAMLRTDPEILIKGKPE